MSFDLGDGSSSLALYKPAAAAQDAGVFTEGSGFRGVSFHFRVPRAVVDEVMGKAVAAGDGVVGEASGRPVRVLRLFQRPGRLPLEGHVRLLTAGTAVA